uniref:G protein-coupled receptor 171 n=1 Tax=Oryzias sinensis TaxID=183150 RepID=A0A8C7WV91_9TELE
MRQTVGDNVLHLNKNLDCRKWSLVTKLSGKKQKCFYRLSCLQPSERVIFLGFTTDALSTRKSICSHLKRYSHADFSETIQCVQVSCLLVPQEKRSAGVYLLNLLLANLLFLGALPFKVLKDLGAAPWSLMVFHCQCSAVLTYISLYASVAFLTFIIVDRYLQDRHSAHSLRLQEPSFAWLLCAVVWLLLLVIMVPNMALPTKQVQVQRYLSCTSLKEELGLRWHTLTVFLNTALFLNASAAVLVSSSLALKHFLRSRSAAARRALVSVTLMALAYVLSFVPYHAVRTPYTLAQTQVIRDCRTRRQLFLGKEATLVLSVLHVCLDPLLFFHLDPAFRGVIQDLLPCTTHCRAAADMRLRTRGNTQEDQEEGGDSSRL